MKRLIYCFILMVLFSVALYAVPGTISYQGKLYQSGQLAEGTFSMAFAIFNSETGGIQLWPNAGYENHTILVTKGIYSAYLGAGNPPVPLNAGVFVGSEAWIEIQINSTSLPRTKIHTVPYAFQAVSSNVADEISGVIPGDVTSGKPVVVDANKDVRGFRNLTIGTSGSEYTLPNTRGNNLEVLTSGPNGTTSWQNITGVLTEFRGNNIGDMLVWDGTAWVPMAFKFYYRDEDEDGLGDKNKPIFYKKLLPGYVENDKDCDDNQPNFYRGSEECADRNCDGHYDDPRCRMFYQDADGDGYSNRYSGYVSISPPEGYVEAESSYDCNDNDPTIYPGATEVCNDGIDNNCNEQYDENCIEICDGIDNDGDGQIDENLFYYADSDGDGYGDPNNSQPCRGTSGPPDGYVDNNQDCDDTDPDIHPDHYHYDNDGYGYWEYNETCDGKDNNCDGRIDEGFPVAKYFRDSDADGWGDPNITLSSCYPPSGFVTTKGDCDDNNNSINPSAPEIKDDIDNDCDGKIDNEICDGIDNDGDDLVDENVITYIDNDRDGYGSNVQIDNGCQNGQLLPNYSDKTGDCNDGNVNIHPGAADLCDGIDNDCDGQTDEDSEKTTYYQDSDGDTYGNPNVTKRSCQPVAGYVDRAGDCDDTKSNIRPGLQDRIDGYDNNCDNLVDNLGVLEGQLPICQNLPELYCEGNTGNCNELISFEPRSNDYYDDYPINGETSGNQYRSYLQREVVQAIKYATAKTYCVSLGFPDIGDVLPLGLGDMSEADGRTPGSSIGDIGHPQGTHTNGLDIDVGYYQMNSDDNHLRPICEHLLGTVEAYHCTKLPDNVNIYQTAIFIACLAEHSKLRVVGVDGKVGPSLRHALSILHNAEWISDSVYDAASSKLAYEEVNNGAGWYLYQYHHMHISFSD